MSQKRERSTNFTREETDLLVELIEENKNIIENKKSDAKTWNEKDRCWKDIEAYFNSRSGIYFRSAKTLKLKYEGMKRDVRKKTALILAETRGGGPSTAPELTASEEKVKKMMSLTVDGMESIYDSDNNMGETEEVYIQPESILTSHHSEDCLEIEDNLEYENSCGENQPTPKMRKQSTEERFRFTSDGVKNGSNPTKRLFEKLAESKLEVANLQKLILEGEYDNKRKQWIFEDKEREQQQRRWDFEEEERKHKREMWALEKKLILKKIEIKNEVYILFFIFHTIMY